MEKSGTGQLIAAGFWQASGQALFWGAALLILGLVGSLARPAQPAPTQEKPKCSA